jgi:hypothetical protein
MSGFPKIEVGGPTKFGMRVAGSLEEKREKSKNEEGRGP